MIYNYKKAFIHDELETKKIKDFKYHVFTQKDFDNYVQEIKEKEDIDVKVIANTKLERVKEEDLDGNKDYLLIHTYYFELLKEKDKKAKFYIPIEKDEFIRVEKKNILPIILLLIGCGVILSASFIIKHPDDISPDPIKSDESQQVGEGDPITTENSDFYQESTIIPGYAKIEADSERNLIPLSNPEENTVKFVYTILVKESEVVDKTFDDYSEAANYIIDNSVEYTNYKDGNNYTLKDSNGDITNYLIEYKAKENDTKTDVIKTTYKVVYFSDGIEPGYHIDWNCYESLGVGDFETQFRISTYDVDTSVQCYGAVQNVHIVVNN